MQKDLSNYLSGGSLVTSLASAYYFQQRITELEQHLVEMNKTVEGLREELRNIKKENTNMKANLGRYKDKSQKTEQRLENVTEFLQEEIGGFGEGVESDDDSDEESESEEQSDSEEEERKPKKKKAKKTRKKRS